MSDVFEIQYIVENVFSGDGVKRFKFHAGELEDDMDDADIRECLYNAVQAHFEQSVYPQEKNKTQFIEWAREQIAKRSSSV